MWVISIIENLCFLDHVERKAFASLVMVVLIVVLSASLALQDPLSEAHSAGVTHIELSVRAPAPLGCVICPTAHAGAVGFRLV